MAATGKGLKRKASLDLGNVPKVSRLPFSECVKDDAVRRANEMGIVCERDEGVLLFRPTEDDMRDLVQYISRIESIYEPEGVAKVRPPFGYDPQSPEHRTRRLKELKVKVHNQVMKGRAGGYQFWQAEENEITYEEWIKKAAVLPKYNPLERSEATGTLHSVYGLVERPMKLDAPDPCDPTMFEVEYASGGNLAAFGRNPSNLLSWLSVAIDGITTPYLYFGAPGSAFAWHCEDLDMASTSYMHFGAHKVWYVVPPAFNKVMRNMLSELAPAEARKCVNHDRHKEVLAPAAELAKHHIPFKKFQHREGEYVLTAPRAFHAGYNSGLNCAEAVNFAFSSWIPKGRTATFCDCGRYPHKLQFQESDFQFMSGVAEGGDSRQVDNEVQCDDCATWRRVGPKTLAHVLALPEVTPWLCSDIPGLACAMPRSEDVYGE